MKMGDNPILTTGGLSNFMEILPDGSFRCRIIICSETDSSIAYISLITMIHSLFKEIYAIVFGNNFVSNFIEAKKYEKLTVLKLFQPKIAVTGESKYVEKFNKLFNDHIMKYGNNIIGNNNRIPLNGFINIDKSLFDLNKVKFNNGVIEYFKNFQSRKTGVKHYIVTSGIKDYVNKTVIGKYVDGVYGVTFNEENGIYKDIDILLTDKKKVDVIKHVQKDNKETNNIIYFGDGLTDSFAFEYVHSIGGKNVFIATKNESMETYKKLNVKGIIDKCFEPDFSMDSELSKYIQTQIEEEKCK